MRSIVIIDDDQNLLEGMKYSVPWEDLQVKWIGEAIDGQEGMKLIREYKPDIVFTDINMPVMNGLEMIEELRMEGFKGKFIILSGYSDFEYARQAVRLQVDDYLSKPVTLDSLQKVLSRVLERLEHDQTTEMEYGALKDQMNHYKPFVIQEWLKSVLTGVGDDNAKNLLEIKDRIELWSSQQHLIIGMEVFMEENWECLEKERNLLRFAIQNVTLEIVREYFPSCDYIELHSSRFAVILHSESLEQSKVDHLRGRLHSYLHNQLKIRVRIELTGVVEDWLMLSESFRSLFKETGNDIIIDQIGIDNIKHKQMIDFMIRYIHEHYADNITISLLADEIQISKNYLGQIFRNSMSETFNQYVTRVRMEKARQMILEGKNYIYEIALKVGYTNIPYFSSQFKKYIGVGPSDLLKNKE